MTGLTDLLRREPIDLGAVAAHLDALGGDERVRQVRAVPGGQQGRLFAAARGWRALDPAHYVPEGVPDRTFVRHFGKNSLPLFSHFEKRFARPEPGSCLLWGFNHGPMMGIVGPGHFVMRSGPEPGELHVDYYTIPPERLDGAPRLARNERGISTLVYGRMVDVLRGVSDHVSVGRAVKEGRLTGNYFLLCRQDPLPA